MESLVPVHLLSACDRVGRGRAISSLQANSDVNSLHSPTLVLSFFNDSTCVHLFGVRSTASSK